MELLRTPDERFDELPDFPFAPNYVEVTDPDGGPSIRVHYVDEGLPDAPIVLLMHGEPSWSYLYRHMIPMLVSRGFRCVAPDLVGFGRSDKPTSRDDHTYARHVEWMREALLDRLDLDDITLFCQDWGGLIGLRLVSASPDRFGAVVASNTGLPTGAGSPPEAFLNWQHFSQTVPDFDSGMIVQMATNRDLTEVEVAAYNAPFPDDSYKEAARIMPTLVPTSADDPGAIDNRAAWASLGSFDGVFVTAFGTDDPITAGGDHYFQTTVAGAAGRPHRSIEGGHHFIQEDTPDALVDAITEAHNLGS